MFMIMAPLSPAAAFCNVPTCSQQQADWISNCIDYTRKHGKQSIEPTADAEARWGEHHDELANATLVPKTKSWYMGTNIEEPKQQPLAESLVGDLALVCELASDDAPSHAKQAFELVVERDSERCGLGPF
jgi:hypothetical protein